MGFRQNTNVSIQNRSMFCIYMGVHGCIHARIPRACSLPRTYMYMSYEQIGKPDYVNHGFQTEYKCKYPN